MAGHRDGVNSMPAEHRPGAGEGNRTLVVSLEGFCSTIELHPHLSRLADIRAPVSQRALQMGDRVGADGTCFIGWSMSLPLRWRVR